MKDRQVIREFCRVDHNSMVDVNRNRSSRAADNEGLKYFVPRSERFRGFVFGRDKTVVSQ